MVLHIISIQISKWGFSKIVLFFCNLLAALQTVCIEKYNPKVCKYLKASDRRLTQFYGSLVIKNPNQLHLTYINTHTQIRRKRGSHTVIRMIPTHSLASQFCYWPWGGSCSHYCCSSPWPEYWLTSWLFCWVTRAWGIKRCQTDSGWIDSTMSQLKTIIPTLST